MARQKCQCGHDTTYLEQAAASLRVTPRLTILCRRPRRPCQQHHTGSSRGSSASDTGVSAGARSKSAGWRPEGGAAAWGGSSCRCGSAVGLGEAPAVRQI